MTDRSRAIPARLHRPVRPAPGTRVVVEDDADGGLAPLPTERVGWNRHVDALAPGRSGAVGHGASPRRRVA